MNELKELLLQAPDGHLDQSALVTIQEWDDQPKAIQVLKTLDICVHAGLASGFAVHVLEVIMNQCLELEGKTYEEILPEATWRNE